MEVGCPLPAACFWGGLPGESLVGGGAPLAPPPVRVPPGVPSADEVALLLVGKNWVCLGVPALWLGVLQLEPLPETLLALLLLAKFIMLLLASIWESNWGFCTGEGKHQRRIEDIILRKKTLLA